MKNIFKLIKENWLTALLVIAIIILLISKFTAKPDVIDNAPLVKQIDSLKNVVIIQKIAAAQAETCFMKKADSIKKSNDATINRMKIKYEQSVAEIKRLPMDSQIAYFKTQVFEDGPYPLAQINGEDSTVMVSYAQFLETNVMFNERNYLVDLKDSLDEQLERSYALVDESKKVIKLKNEVITSQDQLNNSNGILIKNLNANLAEERKSKTKGIIKTAGIAGLVGVGIGMIIMK